MLKPIANHRLHEEVQQQLRNYILDNGLQPGARLPSEGEVARQLGVGRNVVREAFKALEAVGLVEVRMGSGFYVRRFDAARYLDNYTYSLLVDGLGIDEMWAVRRALELSFIREVAEKIRESDFAELDGLLADLDRDFAQGGDLLLSGLRVHQALYRCLGNKVLNSILNAHVELWKQFSGPLLAAGQPHDKAHAVQLHHMIVDALRRHDGEAACAALVEDLPKQTLSWRIRQYTDHLQPANENGAKSA